MSYSVSERVSKSAFRILSKGRVSLVVSGCLMISSVSFAAPVGGSVSAGSALISTSGATTSINQSTQNASINWQSFSVGTQEKVNFVQPSSSSITLNRVVGNEKSIIDGMLSANGQVFILNANGVLFGKNSSVNTAGLLASTMSMSDSDFMSKNYRLTSNASKASVENNGAITLSDGGYAALIATDVKNNGVIHATLGSVLMSNGDQITLTINDNALIAYAIDKAALNSLIENHGAIYAEGGEVYLTTKALDGVLKGVVNNDGIIEATTLGNKEGKIILWSETTYVDGKLDASALNGGNGGFIETSGEHVQIADSARITTKAPNGENGTWLIDPVDFTIAASGGDITGATLSTNLGSGNVIIQSSNGASGTAGDVNVNSAVTWSANTLTLNAQNNININANLNGSGTAKLALEYGQGAVAAGNTDTYTLSNGAKVSLPAGANFSTKLGSNGATTPWTVITSLGLENSVTGTDLQGMYGTNAANAANLAGNYVLGANIDASATSGWAGGFKPVGYMYLADIPNYKQFTGKFDGLGHTISNLSISRVGGDFGLFGTTNNAVLQNVGLLNVAISGGSNGTTGALAGSINGTTTIRNCYVDGGSVSSITQGVGGLVGVVGDAASSISYSYAAVSVSAGMTGGAGYAGAGGLVGVNNGAISYSYATGSVSAPSGNASSMWIGGLAGKQNGGGISYSYATGAVSGNNTLGGLLGSMSGGAVTASYWNTQTTGQATSSGSVAATFGLTTDQWLTNGPFVQDPTNWNAATWGEGNPYPALKALPYLTIAASASQTYGSAATFGIASILDQSGANASGQVNTGGLTWQTDTTATSAAGTTGHVSGSGASATGYQLLYTGSLTVDQAPLTVTASSVSKTYDGLAWSGNNGVAYSGFVNGETIAALGGTLAYGGSAQGAVNAGSYAITPGGVTSGNYAIAFNDGMLRINPPSGFTDALQNGAINGVSTHGSQYNANNGWNHLDGMMSRLSSPYTHERSDYTAYADGSDTQRTLTPQINNEIVVLSNASLLSLAGGGINLPEPLEQLFFKDKDSE